MRDYRINVRFHTDNEAERRAAEYLKTLDRSRNQFVVDAVIAYMDKSAFLNSMREILREEIKRMPVSSGAGNTEKATPEPRENAVRNILADLEMFG